MEVFMEKISDTTKNEPSATFPQSLLIYLSVRVTDKEFFIHWFIPKIHTTTGIHQDMRQRLHAGLSCWWLYLI